MSLTGTVAANDFRQRGGDEKTQSFDSFHARHCAQLHENRRRLLLELLELLSAREVWEVERNIELILTCQDAELALGACEFSQEIAKSSHLSRRAATTQPVVVDSFSSRRGGVSSGNLGTWVEVDMNHHLVHVAAQLPQILTRVAAGVSANELLALAV